MIINLAGNVTFFKCMLCQTSCTVIIMFSLFFQLKCIHTCIHILQFNNNNKHLCIYILLNHKRLVFLKYCKRVMFLSKIKLKARYEMIVIIGSKLVFVVFNMYLISIKNTKRVWLWFLCRPILLLFGLIVHIFYCD